LLLTIQLDDAAVEGADWYEFRLRIGPREESDEPAATGSQPDGRPSAATGTARPSASSNFIVQQAHYEATAAAARQLARERASVERAWQAAAVARQSAEQLWQMGVEAQSRRDHWQRVVDAKRKEQEEMARLGREEDGTLYLESRAYYRYQEARREEEQAEAQRNAAGNEVADVKRRYDAAVADLQKGEAEYGQMKTAYDAAFASLYATEYAQRHAALTARAQDQREESSASRAEQLTAETVLGTYVWMENGCELGQVVVAPKGSFAAPSSAYGKPKGWHISKDGLSLSFENTVWVFLPGPANCLFGSCAGPNPEEKGRKAMLRGETKVEGQPESAPAAGSPGAAEDAGGAAAPEEGPAGD
jgi:hypothetical protein